VQTTATGISSLNSLRTVFALLIDGRAETAERKTNADCRRHLAIASGDAQIRMRLALSGLAKELVFGQTALSQG
jgi:hypothetical protein